MKKTLFLLLALPGISLAEDAGSVGDSSTTRTLELTSYEVLFGENENKTKTLDSGNALMSWHSTTVGEQTVPDAYTFWFMTFSITHAITNSNGSEVCGGPTITTGNVSSSGGAVGLSARVYCTQDNNVVQPNIGIGNGNELKSSTLNFTSGTDVLTFAYYKGTAYIGNMTTASYISYDVSSIASLDTQMNSGASRAWSNQASTKIGATTIASLDNIGLTENETLDMAKLMTTGVAVATLTETGTGEDNPAVTTPTYYKFTADNTIIWTDKEDYLEGTPASTTTSLPTSYSYYSDAEKNTIKAGGDLTELKDRKFVLALGDSTVEGGEVVLDAFSISNGVVATVGGNAKLPGDVEDGGSGYPPDDSNASPLTYSYGILEIAQGSDVVFSNDTGSKMYSYVGSLQMGEGAHMCLDGQFALSVTGLPYVSLEKNAQIKIQGLAQLKLGASHDNEEAWDSVILSGANKGTGTVINKTDDTVELGTETAKDAEFRNLLVQTTGTAEKTIAAQMDNVYLYARGKGGVTVTGSKVEDSTRAIRAIRAGDLYSQVGDVTLLNRTEDVQLETLIIGKNSKVTTRTDDSASSAATVRIDAYNSSLEGTEFWLPGVVPFNGLRTYTGATLDSDLVLGLKDVEPDSGSAQQFVVFQPVIGAFEYGTTEDGYGLNMAGKSVTLVGNIVFEYIPTETTGDGMEILLFSNVGSLTLEGLELDEKYFSRDKEIAASIYFSTSANTTFDKVDAPTGEVGNMEGWFIEYRPNSLTRSGEATTGDVYLTYKVAKVAEDNVPEPTTATLSLLALAALAARRRRK